MVLIYLNGLHHHHHCCHCYKYMKIINGQAELFVYLPPPHPSGLVSSISDETCAMIFQEQMLNSITNIPVNITVAMHKKGNCLTNCPLTNNFSCDSDCKHICLFSFYNKFNLFSVKAIPFCLLIHIYTCICIF